MEHLRQRPLERREQAQDPLNEYANDILIGNEIAATVASLADAEPSSESPPPPSTLPYSSALSRIPTSVESAPGFSFPSAPPSAGNIRATTSTGGTGQRISTPGWILILSGAVLVSLAVITAVIGLLVLHYKSRKGTNYIEADNNETELLDGKDETAVEIPKTIMISRRVTPHSYGKLDEDASSSSASSGSAPTVIHFRASNQLRGFVKLESERRMTSIPEERSLGDLSTLCNDDYIFEDYTE